MNGSHYESLRKNAVTIPLVSRAPEIMSGALCFTGTRVPIQNLFDYLEGSSSIEDFLEDFPSVQRAPIVALLDEARDVGIERRLAEYGRGEVKAIDAEEVFAKARRIAR